MKRYISGLTATNQLTLGNYIGAILPLLKYQEENEIFLFVADLHAVSQGVEEVNKNVEKLINIYQACGLNKSNTKIFIQSRIHGHADLAYLLTSVVYIGELSRMTQFKAKAEIKSKNKTVNIRSGLLFYPILMAADIILYDVDGVIVGNDQKQHLELTNVIVNRINSKFDLDFKNPKIIVNENNGRIMSLKEPLKKMSKSDKKEDATIFLLDSNEDIIRKIKGAVTDSENKIYFDKKNKPGISNLINIYSSLTEKTIKEVEEHFENKNYNDLKTELIELLIEKIGNIRDNYHGIAKNDNKNQSFNLKNEKEIQAIASKNLNKIMRKMGLLNE